MPQAIESLLAGATCASSLSILAARVPKDAWWSLTPRERCFEPTIGDPANWGVMQAEWVVTNAPRGAVLAYGRRGKVPYRASLERPDLRFMDTVGWVDLLLASPEFRDRYRLIAEIGPPPLVRAFALASGTPTRTVDITRCF